MELLEILLVIFDIKVGIRLKFFVYLYFKQSTVI